STQRAASEPIVDSLTFRLRRLSGNQRDAEFPCNGLDLGEVFADDQDTRARMAFEKLTQAHHFRWVFSSDAELRPSVRQCIFHPPLGTHRHALLAQVWRLQSRLAVPGQKKHSGEGFR